jgi:MerR family transcriptional regulator/heat shock protein HspR
MGRLDRDPTRPVYVISVAASIVSVHPRTLRIYEDEGLLCPARTATNIRLYSEEDVRRILWIRHLTQNRGVNLAGIRILFELEERLGTRILETLFDEANAFDDEQARQASKAESSDLPQALGAAPTQPAASVGGASSGTTQATRPPTSGQPPQDASNRTRQVVGADHH